MRISDGSSDVCSSDLRAYTSLPTCAKKGSIAAVMAIYHFSAKVISRANGSSAVASAAYRSASELHDDRLGRIQDFSNKAGVVHSEIMLPEGAPRSEEHTSELQSLMRISYAVFGLKKKNSIRVYHNDTTKQ